MFTNNYYAYLNNAFMGMRMSGIIDRYGAICPTGFDAGWGRYYVGGGSNLPSGELGLYRIRNLITDYSNGVLLGDGSSPESKESYCLSGNIVSGYQYFVQDWVYPETKDNSLFERKAIYTLTNNTKNPMIINEIGYIIQGILVDRTVLSKPLVIEPNGGIGKLTYSLTVSPQFLLPQTNIDLDADDVYTTCRCDYNGSMTRLGGSRGFANPILGESSPFDSVSPWKDMKRYNIINNTISYKEDTEQFNPALETVVYIPTYYYHYFSDPITSSTRLSISATPKEGYIKHPGSGRYVGRYFATAGEDGILKSEPGRKIGAQKDIAEYRKIHERGENFFMMDYVTLEAILFLLYVEFNTFEINTIYGDSPYGDPTGTITGNSDKNTYHSDNNGTYRYIENFYKFLGTIVDGIKYQNEVLSFCINPKTNIFSTQIVIKASQSTEPHSSKFLPSQSQKEYIPMIPGEKKKDKFYKGQKLNYQYYYQDGEGATIFSRASGYSSRTNIWSKNIKIPYNSVPQINTGWNDAPIYFNNWGATRIIYIP